MYQYVLKRLGMMVFVIIGVSFMIYAIMDCAPGDPALEILGPEYTEEEYEAVVEEYGFADPMIVRYGRYMRDLCHGDLGQSIKYGKPVMELYLSRLPATFLLAFAAMVVATLFSIPIGIYAALRHGTLRDNLVSIVAMVGLAAPNFWVGLMLIIAFSLKLGWFASGGFSSWKDVVLPAVTVGTGHMAIVMRTTRSSMLDVIRQDYLMLARAKGLGEKVVIRKHAVRNALIPIITISGIQFTASLGGAVVTESVFSWPGVGRMVVDAIKSQDVQVVTGFIIMTAILSSLVLLLVDILYAFVDPRIKAQYSKD
ncbi:MAG: ABC transporter permease [Clostridiales bacterium]|nr:ABC transporter permease [Clostridiales bacterium]